MERDNQTIDPLDYGLTVPEPEEEVTWDPQDPKATGKVVDLDEPATLGDLGEMGAEIDREEVDLLSSKTEEKLDTSEAPKPEPKRKSRKKGKSEYMKGFEAGSDGAKVWAHLQKILLTKPITHDDVREGYETILGSDTEKAKKQARFLVFTLHKKKKLITRLSRGVFGGTSDGSQ